MANKNVNCEMDCNEMYNCCDCGGHNCGCRYCWSCNACDACKGITDDDIIQKKEEVVIYVKCINNEGMVSISDLVKVGEKYKLIKSDIRNKRYYIHVPNSKCIYLWVKTDCFKIMYK
jgi:hypothetical protein